jgi:hypothetical protein
VELAPAVVLGDLQLSARATGCVVAACLGATLASCAGQSEPVDLAFASVDALAADEARQPQRRVPLEERARGSWRRLREEEVGSFRFAPTDVFAVDGGDSAVWLVGSPEGGELHRRPLDGGPTEVVATSLPVRRFHALHLGIAVVDLGSGHPWEQWLVPLDGSAPARALRAGQNHARAGDELWASDEDGIWKVDAASGRLGSPPARRAPPNLYPDTVGLLVDPAAIYLLDVPGNLVRIDRLTGVARTLATGALHDLAFDGESLLWTRHEEERPGYYSSRRMIMRTPRAGGVSTHLATAERVCGLWAFGDHVYFFAEDQRAQAQLFRTPRRRSASVPRSPARALGAEASSSQTPHSPPATSQLGSEPELVVSEAPWVNTSFDCTERAALVGTTLVWGAREGALVRADLARSPVVIEVLESDVPVDSR